ncbi:MAG: sarcosine oxidase subunit delta [Gammaproteobacteria bacterium]|jgi:sarcosine oxidase subunit delta
MKTFDFPELGRRPSTEFTVAGVPELEPAELEGISASAWVFNRDSVPQERNEWWYHTPTQLWFIVRRDTASDNILSARLAGDPLHD